MAVEIITISIITLALGSLSKFLEKSWLSPGAFFFAFWILCSIVSSQFVDNDEGLFLALVWVLSFCMATHIGAGLGHLVANRAPAVPTHKCNHKSLLWISKVLAVLGLIEVAWIIQSAGFSLTSLVSVSDISEVTWSNRSEYGYGTMNQSLLERVALVLIYAGPLFGGLLFSQSKKLTDRMFAVITVVNVSLVGLLYGSRMGAMYGGSFWIATYICGSLHRSPHTRLQSTRMFLRVVTVCAGLIIGFSLLTMYFRYRDVDDSSLELLQSRLGETFCFFPAFAEWLKLGGGSSGEPTWGYRTFTRVFEFFGLYLAEDTSYRGFAISLSVGYTTSNIFTVFRGLIEDFGRAGALLWSLFFGFTGGFAYVRVSRGDVRYVGPLTMFYAFTFISYGLSLFCYTAPSLALCLFALFCGMQGRFRLEENIVTSSPQLNSTA